LSFSKYLKIANLERLKIKDSTSLTAIKNYLEGAKTITPKHGRFIEK
jgi:hypothetical protein